MLKTEHLTIRFGGLTAVNDVSIEIPDNVIYALIGPNGAGKTTLFNLLTSVYKPTSGTVVFEDEVVSGLQPFQICQKGISRTYQNIRLFKTMSVLETILVGMHSKLESGLFDAVMNSKRQRSEERAAREKAEEVLDFVGLLDKKDALASSLPYGEQRMLEIGRGLANDPKLILLDEPAAGMNTAEKATLMKKIEQIRARGVTVLLVEHDMKLVMGISEYIYVLDYGRLIAQGDPASIQSNPDVISAYLGGA